MLRARAIRKRGQGLNRYQTTDNRHQTKDMGKFFLVSFFYFRHDGIFHFL